MDKRKSEKGKEKAVRNNWTESIMYVSSAQLWQEDWDDSTVSSTISKMRIQKRIEAATRRERALAYAFAQQVQKNKLVNKQWLIQICYKQRLFAVKSMCKEEMYQIQ